MRFRVGFRAAMTAVIPRVFICILNWNKQAVTLACLEAIFAQDYKSFRVIVVDNGSKDGSVAAFRALGDRIDLIEHQENLGFTGGCNAAIKLAMARNADYVWLLNNDIDCDPDTLSILVDFAERHEKIGLVSPVICNSRPVHGTGATVAYGTASLDLATGRSTETFVIDEIDDLQQRHPDQIMLIGTALLIKRAVIERVGLLDDRFFAYCEDNDYCVRATAFGFRLAAVAAARVYHDLGGEPGKAYRKPYAFYYMVRNGILFWRKHKKGFAQFRFARWHACTIFRVLARSGFGREETAAFADGLWSGLLGASGPWNASSPKHRMPSILRQLVIRRPDLCLALMEGSLAAAMRALFCPLATVAGSHPPS